MDRKKLQDAYIRVCRDSGFTISAPAAANLVADMLKTSPMAVWHAMDTAIMDEIAAGRHPAARSIKTGYRETD